MGNQGSEFETQFYKRYSFIQLVQDKLFGSVKVYRKNTVKFDYIMILEVQLEDLPQNQIEILEERLKLIRSHQNQTTLRIYYFKFIYPVKIECRNKRLVIYAEYMNRSIFDYLCALRTNPKFIFQVNEIIYVLRNVAKSCITLKSNFPVIKKWEQLTQIYQRVRYSYLHRDKLFSAHCSRFYSHLKEKRVIIRYQKYSICSLHQNPIVTQFSLRQQFLNILLEMTGNISVQKLQQTKFLYQLIQQSPNLQAFYSKLPQIETETMKIEQMHRMDNLSGEFYQIN